MKSQPQNPEFRNNPENFHPWFDGGGEYIAGYTVAIQI